MMKNINKVEPYESYPNSDLIMKNGVLLPVHHGLTDEMFNKFESTVETFIDRY